jgi:hypothetical protein
MKIITALIFVFVFLFSNGCSRVPTTFIKTFEPTWATIELREDVTYDKAWQSLLDILIRQFDIEMSQKENGYVRTGWVYTWTGAYTEWYRVRVTAKFSENRRILEIKSEAYYKDYVGTDTRLLETIKTDIMGTIGRITR